jgi:hypothetical protein
MDLEKTAGHKSRGYVVGHGLWKCSDTYILDIIVTDADAKSYKHSPLRTMIEGVTQKKRYLDIFLERHKTFMPLVYAAEEMAEKEVKTFEGRIIVLLAEKWGQAYLLRCVARCGQ